MLKYKRILLKLSGESLMGHQHYGIDADSLMHYVHEVKSVVELGVEVSIVIGGGNIFRGLKGTRQGFDRVKGDQMGMLATVINSLALNSAFESLNVPSKVFTAIRMEPVGTLFQKDVVNECLSKGVVCILAGGTGNPYFTTDTAAALRAIETNAEVLLKGTRVDGIYTDDPEKNPQAVKYKTITFSEAYEKQLQVMDLTAFTMCMENRMPIIVFDINTKGNLSLLLQGADIGTIVT
ncbi:MAG: UMP kinase [Bacteroidales bacterium]|nr:UMP kinase [Bacteroidales bacterium]